MAKQLAFWQSVCELLVSGPVILLLVVDKVGSSPGTVGAKMAVSERTAIGTIGGGVVEMTLLETARSAIADGQRSAKLLFWKHQARSDDNAVGSICGGEQTVLLFPCQLKQFPVFERLVKACVTRESVCLRITEQGLQCEPVNEGQPFQIFVAGENWCYREIIGVRYRAYLIGGGHVSLALSKLLDMLDFEITVIDERAELATLAANEFAVEKRIMAYAQIAHAIPEGPNVFVFIMTQSYRTDETALLQLAGKSVAYVGLLGSRRKISIIQQSLRQQLPEFTWQALHAPMGLMINSHTPEEIALSIAAQVVSILNVE